MSAKSERSTGTCEPSAAGKSNPACAMRASSPAVLSATVFPPVFGPVMTSAVTGGISRMSTGTGSSSGLTVRDSMPRCRRTAGISSGCFAARSSNRPSPARAGSTAFVRIEKRARACSTSSDVAASTVRSRSSLRRRNASDSASRIRRTSSCSCCSSATISLLISTVDSGSRNRLAPLPELPCTMPGMAPRCSARTTRT